MSQIPSDELCRRDLKELDHAHASAGERFSSAYPGGRAKGSQLNRLLQRDPYYLRWSNCEFWSAECEGTRVIFPGDGTFQLLYGFDVLASVLTRKEQ